MNTYTNISKELKDYFSNHPIFKTFLRYDVVLVFVGVLYLVIGGLFPSIGLRTGFFGNIFNALAYWAFIFGLLLAYANMHQTYMYLSLFLYGGLYVFNFLKYIRFFNLSYIIYALVYLGLGYLIYKKVNKSAKVESSTTDEE